MANNVDNLIARLQNKPLFSAACLTGCAATFAGFATDTYLLGLAFATAAASPFLCAAVGVSALASSLRDRSGLSKIFSVAAAGAAATGLIGMASVAGKSGFEPFIGFFYTTIATAAASAFNIAAHCTRNVNLSVQAAVVPQKSDKDNTLPPPAI